jgi:hypothetical protein
VAQELPSQGDVALREAVELQQRLRKTEPQRLRVQSNAQIFDRLIRFDDSDDINQAVAQSGEVIKPILWIVDT